VVVVVVAVVVKGGSSTSSMSSSRISSSSTGMDQASQNEDKVLPGSGILLGVTVGEWKPRRDCLWWRTGSVSPDFSNTESESVVSEMAIPPHHT
jgi:hypothetical protein